MNCLNNPQTMARLHAVLTVVWCASIVPTLLWWRESVLWVALCSIYANFVGHWSCWQASRAELEAKKQKR